MSETTPARRIVVDVDGSESAKQALRWPHRVATAEHAHCPVLVVRESRENAS